MNALSLFKIKFAYKGEKEDGCLEKIKLQVMAACTSYTEAESVAMKIIQNENMAMYECEDPEIVRCKTNVQNILLNDTVVESDTLVCGLSELYFENTGDAFFTVKVKVMSNVENGKSFNAEYLLPAKSSVSAIEMVKSFLVYKGYRQSEFKIISHRTEATESLYLDPDMIESKMDINLKMSAE